MFLLCAVVNSTSATQQQLCLSRSLSLAACYTWPITCIYFLQVAVLVLAGLDKFTLWGAVLVDVGTALVVILHGMLLLRWRLPATKSSAKYSSQTQAGACCRAAFIEHNEQLAANSTTGESSCCSNSSKQCSVKVVVQQDGNCAANNGDSKCSGRAAMEQSENAAAKGVDGKPDSCSNNKQCSGRMAADPIRDGATRSIAGESESGSGSKDHSDKAGVVTNSSASKSPCCSSKQCSVKVVQQNGNYAVNKVDSKPPCCSSNKQRSGRVPMEQSQNAAAKGVVGKPECCSSNKQCNGRMAADQAKGGAAKITAGKTECDSGSKDHSRKAEVATSSTASKLRCCSSSSSKHCSGNLVA